jgi:hypothetical protein
MVFDTSGDDVISLMLIGIGNALQGVVIRLCSSAGKNNLLTPGADKFLPP